MANKFSAAGSINNNSSTSGYQLAKGAKPDPIGLKPTEAVVTTNRRWIIGLVLGLIAVAVVAIVAVVYSTGIDKPYQVRESDFKNKIMSRNVEIFLQVLLLSVLSIVGLLSSRWSLPKKKHRMATSRTVASSAAESSSVRLERSSRLPIASTSRTQTRATLSSLRRLTTRPPLRRSPLRS